MRTLMEQVNGWYDQMRHVPRPVLVQLLNLGTKITALVGR